MTQASGLIEPYSESDLTDPILGPWTRGFPAGRGPMRRSQVGAQGWNVLAGDLPLPLAVVREAPLRNNLQWMQQFARSHGVGLAPHGKTSLSPQLFRRQLEAGAWGITVANAAQLQVAVASGVRRCLIANQVLTPPDLLAIAGLLQATPGLRVLFLLDSVAQLLLIEQAAATWSWPVSATVFDVLIELGLVGGRTGCRTEDEALALARAARASPVVRVTGVECYEGLGARGDSAADQAMAESLMQRVASLSQAIDDEGLFECDEVIVSAGGSAIFDLVAPALRPSLSRPVQGLLRSGCYVTHDHGRYRRMVSVLNQRIDCDASLQAALEVWTTVQSMPEPGLAILSAGRRDVSYDIEMPIPVRVCARGSREVGPAPGGWQISAMNDQHAYLRMGSEAAGLQVGDRVALGISHPCTTFDKWRWMAVVDEDYQVIDALVTCF